MPCPKLLAIILVTLMACGCLDEDGPERPELELSILGAAMMDGVWNASGLVEPPENRTFLLLSVELLNNGTAELRGLRATDFGLAYMGDIYATNFLSGDITHFDTLSPTYVESLAASSLPSLMGSLGMGQSMQCTLLFSVPKGLNGEAVLSCSNSSAMGKGAVARTTLRLDSARVFDRAAPRLTMDASDVRYLNRTAPVTQAMTRYLVMNLTVTNHWCRAFDLDLDAVRLIDAQNGSHATERGLPWLSDALAGGAVASGASVCGDVAFALDPKLYPRAIALDDSVPVGISLYPYDILYGK